MLAGAAAGDLVLSAKMIPRGLLLLHVRQSVVARLYQAWLRLETITWTRHFHCSRQQGHSENFHPDSKVFAFSIAPHASWSLIFQSSRDPQQIARGDNRCGRGATHLKKGNAHFKSSLAIRGRIVAYDKRGIRRDTHLIQCLA